MQHRNQKIFYFFKANLWDLTFNLDEFKNYKSQKAQNSVNLRMKFLCLQISQKGKSDFCWAEICLNLFGFLGHLRTQKFHSEINWPLDKTSWRIPLSSTSFKFYLNHVQSKNKLLCWIKRIPFCVLYNVYQVVFSCLEITFRNCKFHTLRLYAYFIWLVNLKLHSRSRIDLK